MGNFIKFTLAFIGGSLIGSGITMALIDIPLSFFVIIGLSAKDHLPLGWTLVILAWALSIYQGRKFP